MAKHQEKRTSDGAQPDVKIPAAPPKPTSTPKHGKDDKK